MPDWSYGPLKKPTAAVVGERRSQKWAMNFLAFLARSPGGTAAHEFIHSGHIDYPVEVDGVKYHSPVGIVLEQVTPARQKALEALGYAFATTEDNLPEGAIRTEGDVSQIVAKVRSGTQLVAVRQSVLDYGPGFAGQVCDVLNSTPPVEQPPKLELWKPWLWPAWWIAMVLGLGMLAVGLFAAGITIGPVLLWYDMDFLGLDRAGVEAINPRLVPFLQHDRITMAGTCLSIGFSYIGLAWGIRKGFVWAKHALVIAGAIGFPTFLLALGYGFFDPLHFWSALLLLGLFLWLAWRRVGERQWAARADFKLPVRNRALLGQLLMVVCTLGLFIGGCIIMIVGLTDVLIPSDLEYMNTTTQELGGTESRLVRFIAHDRAGVGGALASLSAGLLTLSLWGWRQGERWVWWTLALSGASGLVPALIVHWAIGYTDFFHLAPAYFAGVLTVISLWLSRQWFFDEPGTYADTGKS